ncbi:hypothetical protein [Hansschlegelia zhihuaiae]|uniref:Uncharacterized protein n=1 Tax=Hansschlegelia zhihuaiae TaxID=405005 RepID=A0A4Q0MNG5_9HYPH|nr:hypothetical protein [Hansschlegelia zhihuaiae]RXF75304.1 hypothetical protein EK403_00085 [Hansschlegelia zhihuaiae]
MRVVQPEGARGSLKWIQRAINDEASSFDPLVLAKLPRARTIRWLSPLRDDGYAEYRDAAFVAKIGRPELAPDLAEFWPSRGPQWDALGTTDAGQVLLIEAKAHVGEVCSPGTQAGERSFEKIAASLARAAESLGAKPLAPWTDGFYQLANRIAHLWFLRESGLDAYLVLVDFVGDVEMRGPATEEAWDAAYLVANYVLGLGKRHSLSGYIRHVRPLLS